MESQEFKIMSDELQAFKEDGKQTLRSEWLWLQSKGAGKLLEADNITRATERFAVNPDTFMFYAKKMKDFKQHQGRIEYARKMAKNENL